MYEMEVADHSLTTAQSPRDPIHLLMRRVFWPAYRLSQESSVATLQRHGDSASGGITSVLPIRSENTFGETASHNSVRPA